jgi:hypothetical protein
MVQQKDPAVLKALANLWDVHADIAERVASLEQVANKIGEQLDILMARAGYTIEEGRLGLFWKAGWGFADNFNRGKPASTPQRMPGARSRARIVCAVTLASTPAPTSVLLRAAPGSSSAQSGHGF